MFFNDEWDFLIFCNKTVKSLYLGFCVLSATVRGSPASLTIMGVWDITQITGDVSGTSGEPPYHADAACGAPLPAISATNINEHLWVNEIQWKWMKINEINEKQWNSVGFQWFHGQTGALRGRVSGARWLNTCQFSRSVPSHCDVWVCGCPCSHWGGRRPAHGGV